MSITVKVDEPAVKRMARRLQAFVAGGNGNFGYMNALEGVSQVFGYANMNTLRAVLRAGDADAKITSEANEAALLSAIDGILAMDPDEITVRDRNLAEQVVRGKAIAGCLGGPRGGWFSSAERLEEEAKAESDSLKALKADLLLILETTNEYGPAARVVVERLRASGAVFGKSPEELGTWVPFWNRVFESNISWLFDRESYQEIWVVMTPDEVREVWRGATGDKEDQSRFLAFPVGLGKSGVDLPDDVEKRMVVADNPDPIVNAVSGREIAVWEWPSIERLINTPRRSVGKSGIERSAARMVLAETLHEMYEPCLESLWLQGRDGGASLNARKDGSCDEIFVAGWMADLLSYMTREQDSAETFVHMYRSFMETEDGNLDDGSYNPFDGHAMPAYRSDLNNYVLWLASDLLPLTKGDGNILRIRARSVLIGLLALFVAKIGPAAGVPDWIGIPEEWHGQSPSLGMTGAWLSNLLEDTDNSGDAIVAVLHRLADECAAIAEREEDRFWRRDLESAVVRLRAVDLYPAGSRRAIADLIVGVFQRFQGISA